MVSEAIRPENIAPINGGPKVNVNVTPPKIGGVRFKHVNKPISEQTKNYLGQAFTYSRRYGWGMEDLVALHELAMRESGWNPKAANPSSSARGIAQTMMSAHFGPNWRTDPKALKFLQDPSAQIKWMVDYIHRKYGSPMDALRHHEKRNWY